MAIDIVERIRDFNAGRDPERLRIKYRRLRTGAFAFLRGTCHLFYDRLSRGSVFKSAPLAWICGDLHPENFGSYMGDNHLVYFDLNDFDEAALAPASWDLVRMLASLQIGAAGAAPRGRNAPDLGSGFLEAYGASLSAGKAYWVERDTAHGPVRVLLDALRNRRGPQFLAAHTHLKGRRRILQIDGKRALPATKAERDAISRALARFAATQPAPGFYTVLDVARRIAGTGSLGLDRYVILVQGKGSLDGNYLLDLKACQPSSLDRHLRVRQPRWRSEADRVVTIQRRVQAVPMVFLQSLSMDKTSYLLRALQPTQDRIAIADASTNDLMHLARTFGHLVAWAQLRSAGLDGSATADELIDFGRRTKWRIRLLESSAEAVAHVTKDAATFAKAFDAGAFD